MSEVIRCTSIIRGNKGAISEALTNIATELKERFEQNQDVSIKEYKGETIVEITGKGGRLPSEFRVFLSSCDMQWGIGIAFNRHIGHTSPNAVDKNYYVVSRDGEPLLFKGGLCDLLGLDDKPRNVKAVFEEILECIIQDKLPRQ